MRRGKVFQALRRALSAPQQGLYLDNEQRESLAVGIEGLLNIIASQRALLVALGEDGGENDSDAILITGQSLVHLLRPE